MNMVAILKWNNTVHVAYLQKDSPIRTQDYQIMFTLLSIFSYLWLNIPTYNCHIEFSERIFLNSFICEN